MGRWWARLLFRWIILADIWERDLTVVQESQVSLKAILETQ
jgi:hypothetical protein